MLRLYFVSNMNKGFASDRSKLKEKKNLKSSVDNKGRLISWSPWPPADFKSRYPAFPFVLTILIIVIGQWYFSLLR